MRMWHYSGINSTFQKSDFFTDMKYKTILVNFMFWTEFISWTTQ
jgi:hypothetical protein